MTWRIEFLYEAEKDMKKLDHSVQIQVLKGIRKVGQNPLPTEEGGYGKPLGNKSGINLTNFMKIKFRDLGIRVVYKVEYLDGVMKIIVVSARTDEQVYKEAEKGVTNTIYSFLLLMPIYEINMYLFHRWMPLYKSGKEMISSTALYRLFRKYLTQFNKTSIKRVDLGHVCTPVFFTDPFQSFSDYCVAICGTICYGKAKKGGIVMATRSANVNVRVEPDIKKQAEAILETLGVSVSSLINMTYRQVILRNGIPFSVTIPSMPKTRDTMTDEEFNEMMEVGWRQAMSGENFPVDEAFDKIQETLG